MKTYILRDPKTVGPQPPSPFQRPDPALDATVDQICGVSVPPPPALAGPILYVGLDVHNDSIAVSLAPSESTEVRRYGLIGDCHDDIWHLIKKISMVRRFVGVTCAVPQ